MNHESSKTPPGAGDPLEDFVARNRAAFDDVRAPRSMWAAISADLDAEAETTHARTEATRAGLRVHRRTTSLSRKAAKAPVTRAAVGRVVELYPLWRKLAVACMLLTIGVLAGLLMAERVDGGAGMDIAAATGSAGSRSADIERQYREQLDARLAQVEALSPDSALRAELVSIAQPDYRAAADLGNLAPTNERLVIETMALEYQAKLEVVEHILARLRAAEELRQVRGDDPESAPEPKSEPTTQRL